jgi:gamma-aminobutyric acid type B receptor
VNTTTSDQNATTQPTAPLCMIPSLSHLPRGTAALISSYGWVRVAVLTEQESQLVMDPDELYQELVDAGITDIMEMSLSLNSSLSDALHRDYRIVILNSTPVLSRLVLCEAVRRNLNRYVWITPGWYPHGWWSSERGAPVGDSQSTQSPSSCSDSDLEQFIGNGSRVLSILQSPPHASNNSRWMEFQQMMCQEKGLKDCVYASLAYDAVWAVAEALTETGDLRAALVNSTFDGVSGSVEFDSQSYRVLGGYRLGQMRFTSDDGGLESIPVATLTEDGTSGGLVLSYLHGESELTVWGEGGPPPDGSPQTELKYPLTSLVVICSVLSGAVIVWAIGCILFNLYFRKKKIIKLTSPTLNMMIAVGIILTNLSTPLTMYPGLPGLEEALPTVCILRSWLLPIGWSLSLCTISVKMWRVFVIYRTTKKLRSLKEKRVRIFLQDGFMVTVVLCMVVVDVIVLIIGTSLPQTRFTPQRVPDREFPPYRNSEDVEVVYENLQCVSDKGLIWVAFLFGYKIVFIISGVVLAVLSRKVKVKGLNESREVQVAMIISTPIVITGLVLRLLLSDYLNVVGTLYALGGSLYGGLILGIIFLPKMVYLCKNPSGDQIYSSKIGKTQSQISRDRSATGSSVVAFDPTLSLKSLIRKNSVESGLGSSVAEEEGKFLEKDCKNNSLPRHILPTIEESACSNGTTPGISDFNYSEDVGVVTSPGGSSSHPRTDSTREEEQEGVEPQGQL